MKNVKFSILLITEKKEIKREKHLRHALDS